MSRDSLLLPGVVLVGSAMIGAGLYFGLRAQSSAPGAPPPVVHSAEPAALPILDSQRTTTATAPDPALPNPAPPNPAAPFTLGSPETRARAAADAKVAVDAEKKANWVANCWTPMLATSKDPSTSKYSLSLAFDADGKLIGRGVSELRDVPSRPDVAACLSRQPLNLKITPSGSSVSVEVSLEFP